MKKLMLLMTLACFILLGCAKEELTTAALSTADQQVDESGVWIINTDEDNLAWEFVTMDEQPSIQSTSSTASTRDNNGNSAHAHGDFATVVFSGTENNGGTHGSATVSLGPNTYTCETECVMVDGSEAVYGGTITEVAGPPPPPGPGPPVYSPGDHVYFKVFDNGQGNNAPADQFHGFLKFTSADNSKCGVWTPNSGAWPETFTCCGGLVIDLINDVQEPGSIKVNN